MNKWIWEVAELGNTTRKADREALKYFLSLERVTERFPYGRRPVTKPAITSFIGTLNDEGGVLTDPTGSRRFMFIKIDSIDWPRYTTTLTPDLIWAEAYSRYRQGENSNLTPEEKNAVAMNNSEFDAENPVEGLLLKFFTVEPENTLLWTPTQEIVTVLLRDGLYHGISDKLTKDLASLFAGLGCLKERKVSWTNPDGDSFKFSSKATGYCGVIKK
jgi:predicted P-loop ATPase